MQQALMRYATPFITGLFLISLISGVALFVHVGTGSFREMHEWLSMVLIIPFGLHIWKNWRAMTIYFKKPAFAVAMLLSLGAALGFVYQSNASSGRADGPPQFALTKALISNSPAKLAPLFGYTPESLVEHLKAAGFTAASAELSATDIAVKSGKDEFALAAALLPAQ
jgi:hypothetical protein